MKLEALTKAGLSEGEAKIYTTLLRLGLSKAGKISKESGLNRTSSYDALNRLIEKGLVTWVVESKIKHYQAVNPLRLMEVLQENQREIKLALPQLITAYKNPQTKSNITLYHGYRGVKSCFMDFVRTGGTIRILDSEGYFIERMPDFAKFYIKQIEKKKIKILHLVREGREDIKPSKTTEIRLVKKPFKSDSSLDIYGNKICIIVWSEPPEAVIVENKNTADSLRFYFDLIWKGAKKI